jgi:hypothetical protein
MPETTSPTMVKILEVGSTSSGGGLHEEGDLGTDEMWHATMLADVPAPMAMTMGDSTDSAAGASPMAPNPSPTSVVGGMLLGDSTRAWVP